LGAVAPLALACALPLPASSQAAGPSIFLDRGTARPGETIVVRLRGWQVNAVTLSLCGNLARRGSVDCDLVASQGVPLARQSPESLSDFVVTAPPTTCPCVIRASDSTQSEVAYAPIVVSGVPVASVVGPVGSSAVEVSVRARRARSGLGALVRSSLGGSASYDVTVLIRNRSPEALANVRLFGWAGRSRDDQARAVNFPDPGAIGPGAVWSHVVRVRAPAPHIGRFYWEVLVSGAGPAVHAESITHDVPFLLFLVILVIVADLAAMAGRRIRRRRDAPPRSWVVAASDDRHVDRDGVAAGRRGCRRRRRDEVSDAQPVATGCRGQ
jgi:hypothetical protein